MNDAGGSIPAIRAISPAAALRGSAGLQVCIIVAMAAFDIVRSYRVTVEDTRRGLETQARIIAEQTARSVHAIDVVLRHIASEFRRGRLQRLSPVELHAYLNDQAVGLVQIDGFVLLDGNGDATVISWMPLETHVNVAHFEGYLAVERIRGPASSSRGDAQPHRWPVDDSARASARNTGRRVRRRRRCARPHRLLQQFYRDVRLDAGTAITR